MVERRHNESMSADDEIVDMVRNTNDPQTKSILLVMLRFSHGLNHNTSICEASAREFSAHRQEVNEYMARGTRMLNRGLGAWSALMFVGFILWAGITYVFNSKMGELTLATTKNIEQDIRLSTHDEQIRGLQQDRERQRSPPPPTPSRTTPVAPPMPTPSVSSEKQQALPRRREPRDEIPDRQGG